MKGKVKIIQTFNMVKLNSLFLGNQFSPLSLDDLFVRNLCTLRCRQQAIDQVVKWLSMETLTVRKNKQKTLLGSHNEMDHLQPIMYNIKERVELIYCGAVEIGKLSLGEVRIQPSSHILLTRETTQMISAQTILVQRLS